MRPFLASGKNEYLAHRFFASFSSSFQGCNRKCMKNLNVDKCKPAWFYGEYFRGTLLRKKVVFCSGEMELS